MKPPFSLFSVFGLETEYMIVNKQNFNVLPLADLVLENNFEQARGELTRCAELANHVLELKTTHPHSAWETLLPLWQNEIKLLNQMLDPLDACLLPTGMHPWMNPQRETVLWPHEWTEIYQAFHSVFNCHTHGFANMQSIHINLPYSTEQEFRRLHSAIRVVLPLLPALSASSPFLEGEPSGWHATRIKYYQTNCSKYPEVSGKIIPEVVHTTEEYKQRILDPIQKIIALEKQEEYLEALWVNARGAIARPDRNSLEIRILDSQECVRQDLLVARAVVEAVRQMTQETNSSLEEQENLSEETLVHVLTQTAKEGETAFIDSLDYLALFGLKEPTHAKVLWQSIYPKLTPFLERGTLSTRLLKAFALGDNLQTLYQKLAKCLAENDFFDR